MSMDPSRMFDMLSGSFASLGVNRTSFLSFLKDNHDIERMLSLPNVGTGMNSLALGRNALTNGDLDSLGRELAEIRVINARERNLPAMKISTQSTKEALGGFVVYNEGTAVSGREVEIKRTIIGIPWSYSQESLVNLKRSMFRIRDRSQKY